MNARDMAIEEIKHLFAGCVGKTNSAELKHGMGEKFSSILNKYDLVFTAPEAKASNTIQP